MVMRIIEERLEHVRYISENFSYLRGFTIILLGLPIFLIGLIRWWLAITNYAYIPHLTIFSLGLFLLVGILIYFQFKFIVKVNAYYARTFGEVETSAEQKRRQFQISWIVVIPIMIAFIIYFAFDVHNMFIAGVVFSKGLESFLFSGPRLDAKLFGSSFILMSLAVFVVPVDLSFHIDLAMGGALMAQGLMNHVYLRRHLHVGEQHA